MAKLSIDPNPLKQGGSGTLKGIPGAEVALDWDPHGEPTALVIGQNGEVEFTVPSNARSLAVRDEFGNEDAALVQRP